MTVPRRYFFCGSFMFLFCLVFAMSLYASVYMCFVVTCWERADLLALVCGVYCEFVTFPLVSWVRCGALLYRFLIFAPLLTLTLTSITPAERHARYSIDLCQFHWSMKCRQKCVLEEYAEDIYYAGFHTHSYHSCQETHFNP